jgi:hypothetical protein
MSIESNSLNEIKSALKTLKPQQLQEYLLRMAKYKKENKELLSFILFLEQDISQFVKDVKHEIDLAFDSLHISSTYLSAKGLRKILKFINKFIKFTGSKEVELELLIYLCLKIKRSPIRLRSSVVLTNLYRRQMERAVKAMTALHEDKQHDYATELYEIQEY